MGNTLQDFPLILLAGGKSSRMGTPKGLVDYQGQPWLLEQLGRFRAACGERAMVQVSSVKSQGSGQGSVWMMTSVLGILSLMLCSNRLVRSWASPIFNFRQSNR